jgi:hypothetical protein
MWWMFNTKTDSIIEMHVIAIILEPQGISLKEEKSKPIGYIFSS